MPSHTTRRAVLGASGSLLAGGLAGCLGEEASTGTRTTASTTETPATNTSTTRNSTTSTTTTVRTDLDAWETATVGGRAVSVGSVAAQRQVALRTSSHVGMAASREEQYLVATVRVADDGPGRCLDEVRAAALLGGRRFEVGYACLYQYGWGETSARVGFALPADVSVGEARVEWRSGGDRASWLLGDDLVARLNDPPSYRLRSFEVPETAAPGEAVTARIEVENAGGSDGEFRYVLDYPHTTTPSRGSLAVPAGERASRLRSFPAESVAGRTSPRVRLDTGYEKLTRAIALQETTDAG